MIAFWCAHSHVRVLASQLIFHSCSFNNLGMQRCSSRRIPARRSNANKFYFLSKLSSLHFDDIFRENFNRWRCFPYVYAKFYPESKPCAMLRSIAPGGVEVSREFFKNGKSREIKGRESIQCINVVRSLFLFRDFLLCKKKCYKKICDALLWYSRYCRLYATCSNMKHHSHFLNNTITIWIQFNFGAASFSIFTNGRVMISSTQLHSKHLLGYLQI